MNSYFNHDIERPDLSYFTRAKLKYGDDCNIGRSTLEDVVADTIGLYTNSTNMPTMSDLIPDVSYGIANGSPYECDYDDGTVIIVYL